MKCKHYLKAAAGHYRSASDKPWMTFRWRADGCPRRMFFIHKVQFKWPHSHRYYPGCYFPYLHLKTYVVGSQWKRFIVTLPMKPRLMFLINNKPKYRYVSNWKIVSSGNIGFLIFLAGACVPISNERSQY